jgi:hypothetical protein
MLDEIRGFKINFEKTLPRKGPKLPEMIWHTGCTIIALSGTDASGSRIVLVEEHAGCQQRFDA